MSQVKIKNTVIYLEHIHEPGIAFTAFCSKNHVVISHPQPIFSTFDSIGVNLATAPIMLDAYAISAKNSQMICAVADHNTISATKFFTKLKGARKPHIKNISYRVGISRTGLDADKWFAQESNIRSRSSDNRCDEKHL